MIAMYLCTKVKKQILTTFMNSKINCGNYDGDDYENCDDYDPDEDLRMMYDDEELSEQYDS